MGGTHFFKVEGNELREFKHKVNEGYSVKSARDVCSVIDWTERGAARHAKRLKTDQVGGVSEKPVDNYFCNKQKLPVRHKILGSFRATSIHY
ncbi:hypothetical protein [Pantoea sp. AS142]|uniref:hypothetical protein n=1 Tax=Pantoea sp. AS142 TaxID=3081292 RepID=UPI003FA74227